MPTIHIHYSESPLQEETRRVFSTLRDRSAKRCTARNAVGGRATGRALAANGGEERRRCTMGAVIRLVVPSIPFRASLSPTRSLFLFSPPSLSLTLSRSLPPLHAPQSSAVAAQSLQRRRVRDCTRIAIHTAKRRENDRLRVSSLARSPHARFRPSSAAAAAAAAPHRHMRTRAAASKEPRRRRTTWREKVAHGNRHYFFVRNFPSDSFRF